MNALVVPTIRENCMKEFLKKWQLTGLWDVIIIVEDNPKCTFSTKADFHYCWEDIDKDLGHQSMIISRRDSGIKCYGFFKAWEMGATHTFCLDDDCLPIDAFKFRNQHIANLETTKRWAETVPGLRTRGIPYHNQGILPNVVFSVGLWTGVPDFDAIQQLSQGIPENFSPPNITRVMPHGQFFPFCGMNFAFRSEVTPLCYFPLMGPSSGVPPYGRFDDIWFGLIAKKICDHLDYHIVCGEPFVYHTKASNVFNNLIKEGPGIALNETLWQTIDEIKLKEHLPRTCMKEIGESLATKEHAYISLLGKAIQEWAGLFGG